MPDVDLKRMIGPLGRRLVSRQQRMSQATGLGLARSVADRRRPRALQAATRLAVGRTIVPREVAPPPPVEAEQAAPLPDYISPFAAAVLFGEGAPVDSEQEARYAAYQEREEARMEALRSGAVPRGLVHEGPGSYEGGNGGLSEGGQFRLSPRIPTSPHVSEAKPADTGSKPGAPTADRQSAPVQRIARATRSEPSKPAERARPSEPVRDESPPAAAPTPGPASEETAAPPEAAAPERPAPVVPTRVAAERDPEAPAADPPGRAPVPFERVVQPPVDAPEPDTPSAVVPELRPAAEDAVPEPTRDRTAPPPLETPPAATISTPETPATPLSVTPTPEPPRPPASETPEVPRAAHPPAPPASAAPRSAPPRRSEPPAAAAAGPAKPAAPVRVQRIARTEAKPARPVLARRPAPPPPVVEVPVPTAEFAPQVEAPAEMAPPPRTLFRRLADVFRGPRRAQAPEPPAEEPTTGPEPVAMDAVPATPVQRRAAAPPIQTAESAPAPTEHDQPSAAEPVPEPRRGLRAAVARVLRQPSVGTALPSGLGPSPVPGPGGGRPDATRTPSTPSPGPTTPGGTGGGAGGSGGTPSPDGGGGGAAAGGGDSSQTGGNQSVQANSVTMGATTVGGSQSVSSGTSTTMGPANVGATQTVTSGAATIMSSAEAGGNQSVQSGGAAITGPMTAGGSQTILTGGLMNVKGGVSGGGAMNVTAGMVRASGPVAAGGPMALGGAVKAGTVTAGTIIGNVTGGTVINMGGGGAGGGAGGPVSRMAADRPKPVPVQNIRVGSAPTSLARRPQPARELPPAPAPVRTSGAAIAAATGAPIQRTPAGAETVSFPQPRELPIQALPEPIIQRAEAPESGPTPAPAPPSGGSGKDSGADIQELAEKVMEVMKREAMIERERRGDLT